MALPRSTQYVTVKIFPHRITLSWLRLALLMAGHVQVGEALLSIDMEGNDSEAEAVSTSSQDAASQASPTSSGMPAADGPLPADTQVTLLLRLCVLMDLL